jgi:hypothetical protein
MGGSMQAQGHVQVTSRVADLLESSRQRRARCVMDDKYRGGGVESSQSRGRVDRPWGNSVKVAVSASTSSASRLSCSKTEAATSLHQTIVRTVLNLSVWRYPCHQFSMSPQNKENDLMPKNVFLLNVFRFFVLAEVPIQPIEI